MKLLQVGIGTYGSSWYERIKKDHADLEVVVVEKNLVSAKKTVSKNDRVYISLREAIEKENPDFIFNVTPPAVHSEINHIAFDYKLPVLCEKPIADDYASAILIVERANKERIPFMIAENYRTFPEMRKTKKLLSEGSIGDIVSVNVDFYRCNIDKEGRYLSGLQHPLLEDVAIHHFDLLRYVTESDMKSVYARSFNPKNSWYTGNASLMSIFEMKNGIVASYSGSLAAKGESTQWHGEWRIDGTEGSLVLENGCICMNLGNQTIRYADFNDIEVHDCLDEFVRSLREGRDGETSGREYIKTQAMVHYSLESIKTGRMIDISQP